MLLHLICRKEYLEPASIKKLSSCCIKCIRFQHGHHFIAFSQAAQLDLISRFIISDIFNFPKRRFCNQNIIPRLKLLLIE
ncbi:hypothetical protein D3C78_1250340 [compost metagenome]